jgi:hypothetical protein
VVTSGAFALITTKPGGSPSLSFSLLGASHLQLRATVAAMAPCFAHAFFFAFFVFFVANFSSRRRIATTNTKGTKTRGIDAMGGQ